MPCRYQWLPADLRFGTPRCVECAEGEADEQQQHDTMLGLQYGHTQHLDLPSVRCAVPVASMMTTATQTPCTDTTRAFRRASRATKTTIATSKQNALRCNQASTRQVRRCECVSQALLMMTLTQQQNVRRLAGFVRRRCWSMHYMWRRAVRRFHGR